MALETAVFRRYSVRVMKTGRLVSEEIRTRLKRAVMQWLGIYHEAILPAAVCLGQAGLLKYSPKPDLPVGD
jgi:hypothetical protein